jgi:uncharacterized membrane protein YoaK (UPF0700 family)
MAEVLDAHDPAAFRRSRNRASRQRSLLALALAIGSGSLDAVSYLGLGKVFASVITGNLVLLGVGIGRHEGSLATTVAFATLGYVIGVAVGVAIARTTTERQPLWPQQVNAALRLEFVLLGGFAVGWELVSARPVGAVRIVLLALVASCMGIQGAAVNRLHLPGFGTTFLTSTFMRAITGLMLKRWRASLPEFSAVLATTVGALVGALLMLSDRPFAPLVALGLLGSVIVTAAYLGRTGAPFSFPDEASSEEP